VVRPHNCWHEGECCNIHRCHVYDAWLPDIICYEHISVTILIRVRRVLYKDLQVRLRNLFGNNSLSWVHLTTKVDTIRWIRVATPLLGEAGEQWTTQYVPHKVRLYGIGIRFHTISQSSRDDWKQLYDSCHPFLGAHKGGVARLGKMINESFSHLQCGEN
jgi:hypothetical protein